MAAVAAHLTWGGGSDILLNKMQMKSTINSSVKKRRTRVVNQKNSDAPPLDNRIFRERFFHHAIFRFVRAQRIKLWWNDAACASKYSDIFTAALLAILNGDFAGAKRLHRKATLGFLKRPLIVFAAVFLVFSFIPFLWLAFSIALLMVARRIAWLLYAEAEFLCDTFGRQMPNPDDRNWPFSLMPMNPNGGRFRRFMEGVNEKLPRSRLLASAYADFDAMQKAELEYEQLPVKNCAVCATMSAGKSTFVNALLGMDVLPARHGAATAKVTSVYDKDGTDGLIGFVQDISGGISEVCDGVNASILDEWNSDRNIARIFLQGDLDGIANQGFKVAVHDTPGTNNSDDCKHHTITKKFLLESSPNIVVYVANTEHLCTTDEQKLLKELRSIVRQRNTPVLFVLNKADSIDTGKEDLPSLIDSYKAFLDNMGFSDPMVRPVSSKAARLLKMALNGRSAQFSEMERDDFPLIVRRFTNRMAFDDVQPKHDYGNADAIVSVDGEEYDSSALRIALTHTGIHGVETALETFLTSVAN